MSVPPPDCTPKCRSLQHASEVVAALTTGAVDSAGSVGRLLSYLSGRCHNVAALRDAFGRTALHMCASLGLLPVLEWVLQSKSADPLVKDKESGWTAQHRSAFYGHIHCLLALVKYGGLITTLDKEGLSVLDLTMKDRPQHVVFRSTDPTEVYTWGNNTNFSLGHGNQESRNHPEIVDVFSRTGVFIKQVVLCKFHSVFLSQKGQVFTCGHGQGGRLGHGDEQTYLVPRLVEGLLSHHCSQVAAAKDHTVVLTEEGYVYTFGLNTFHQLGLTPPPASINVPKQVLSRCLKGRVVVGVSAGRFHTVLWTREAVYTMGLNGGQLGYLLDPNGEKCVTSPRQVSALHHKEVTIAMVAASDGATVCVTERGDVYLLADYQCRKLASRQLNIKKVLVSGGCLDHRVNPQVLTEGGGEKVSVLALDQAGRVFCWRSTSSPVKSCRWAYGRQVFIADMALSKNRMMFVTQDGEGFSGQWQSEEKRMLEKKDAGGGLDSSHFETSGAFERIKLERILFIHRAVSITMDSKGRNFGVLQSDPKTSLYEIPFVSTSLFSKHFHSLLVEASETDSIHDVILQAGGRSFPAHKFILSVRSDFFRRLLYTEPGNRVEEEGVTFSKDSLGCDLLELEKVPSDMLEQILHFIYTDSCQMLEEGFQPSLPCQGFPKEATAEQLICSLQELGFSQGLAGRAAVEVYRSLPVSDNGEEGQRRRTSKAVKKGKGKETMESGINPVKALQTVAKRLGIGALSLRLDGVKYENGRITVVQKKSVNKLKLSQRKCSYLCDVTLQSEDGKDFPCHKCVLCARLEYFHSMLGNPWIEASCCTALVMPTSAEVLDVVLEYVYTDESVTVRESQNVEFVCSVLAVADQLLIPRLKEICEVTITENLTLKNVAELLEFSSVYNAQQLKLSCFQFIVLNMAALLESRSLDVLSIDVQHDLSAAYRAMVPAMQKRVITPYPDAPDLSPYESLDWSHDMDNSMELDLTSREKLLKKAKTKAKRKSRKRSNSSGGYNVSDLIPSSPSAGVLQLGKTSSIESLQDLLTSDSEGSYAGLASPRDLQSPVFHDKEKLSVMTPPQTPDSKSGMTPLSWICSPVPTAKPRMSVPQLPPVQDLRVIMEMEAHSQSLGPLPKSPGCSKPSLPPKLSQKQRKMMAMFKKEVGAGVAGEKFSSAPTQTKSMKAWATPLNSPPLSRCFRDLLVEERNRVGTDSEGLVGPSSSARKVTFKSPDMRESDRPVGPWALAAGGSPPTGITVNFASIVEEERQQEAALIRSREKPLALIQIEECAIQELLIHYKASDNPEEFIVVERSSQGPIATPTWSKH